MKDTGIIRPIDELGRIVLPMELRRSLDLNPKDGVEVFVEKDRIILKKHVPSCIFCGGTEELSVYKDKPVCASCLADLGSHGAFAEEKNAQEKKPRSGAHDVVKPGENTNKRTKS